MTLRRLRPIVAALASLLLLALVVGAPTPVADAAASSSSVTRTETVERTYLDNGTKTVVDKRNISLTVDVTTGLRSLQLVNVSWSGAHPTGGLVADQNSDLAQNEEYPFALFECRGTDTAAHPITPETCWTQYADERFDYGSDDPAYPAWRSDAQASAADRAAFAGAPAAIPSACASTLFETTYQRWVPFLAAGGQTFSGGPFGCGGLPPEAGPSNLTSNLALPSNETFGVTDRNGNGSAQFDVFTTEDHPSLGCSATVACSLVAVPVMGISCDPSGSLLPADQRPAPADVSTAQANCESTGNFAPGQMLPSQASGDPAVDGSLWWSASNWDNRISIPLTFATADNVCALNSSAVPVPVYGSELMIQATTQWAPAFCLNPKLFDLTHV
ncbi:MAG: hypothetical protein J0H43_04785, partial [Actinobacteria bacterium]|nr:hypothetical protein [Actinomycetota bacterium]